MSETNATTTALAYPVRTPGWMLSYTGTDISADISRMVVNITYTDQLGGRAGEIEVDLEDSAKRWQGPWYPALGDSVSLWIGYAGEQLLPCGDFQIDQLELSGPPDVFHMKCLAAWVTPALRTPTSAAYENQNLAQITTTVAARHGLSVLSQPAALNPVFARITQRQEGDAAFLKRIAGTHGYEFTVRGSQVIFYARTALESQVPVMAIGRSDVERFSFENLTRRIYRGAQVSYQDPASRQLISQSVKAADVATGDTLKLTRRCENGQQAMLRAQAALDDANRRMFGTRLTLPGTTVLCAGSTVALNGFGDTFDTTYLIEVARHRLDRSHGYRTDIEARHVAS